jgi:hypothetical protein
MHRIRFAALLAALALIPAAAHAQSTITACYVPKTGSVYRIQAAGAPEACKTNHVEFSWESSGTVFTRRVGTGEVVTPNSFEQFTAACEAGESVVGGGWATNPNLSVSVSASLPVQPPAQEWFVDLRNLSSIDVTAWAYAICAKPAT